MRGWLRAVRCAGAVLALMSAVVASQAAAGEVRAGEGGEWRFRVFLDDRAIGYHEFQLSRAGETRHLRSVANFEYKLLFVRLYHYEHENVETWSGGCLQRIQSRTDANGRAFEVAGWREEETFRVEASAGDAVLPGCVMSFAYWNPEFLEQQRLLNTQNGEYMAVEVSGPEPDAVEVRGEMRFSYRYRLAAGPLQVDLWYSPERQWLALESQLSGGRTLRYELM